MTCHSRNPPTTTTSVAENVRQRDGMIRCIRRPSSWSSRHSATSATTVATIANSIAPSFSAVGLVVKRVSMVAESESPCGAGPLRLVKTPTTLGRRFGSANPVRSSRPSGPLSPTNVANVPVASETMSMREHPGAAAVPTAWARGTLATTTLRSVTFTRVLVTLTNSALSAASLVSAGAVPNTRPPDGGICPIRSHGTLADIRTGVSVIRGAVTLPT